MKYFSNANVYINGKIEKTTLCFSDRVIGFSCEKTKENAENIKLPERSVVLPGFIDEHIHGAAGYDVMDGNGKGLADMAEFVASEGTVAFLATTVTASREKTLKAIDSVVGYVGLKKERGSEILGMHLEGPFLSEEYAGAMNKKYLSAPDKRLAGEYIDSAKGLVKIFTYAPENDENDEFLKYITGRGIVASAGHSAAAYARVREAELCGLTNVTHTFNAQSPFKHREIGCAGAALLSDDLNCEIISDTIHVSVPALKLLVKNKPKNRLILVTDSMRAKGCGEGISEIGGQKVIVKNGQARLENGTLAGSILKMNEAVRNMVIKAGVPFCDAVDYASKNPARVLRVENDLGSIAIGKRACFTVLDENFEVLFTFRDGNVIYKKHAKSRACSR